MERLLHERSALSAFIESLSNELAGAGVKVFAFDPGLVRIALLDGAVDGGIP
jgi:short-subunit dehydrogenase